MPDDIMSQDEIDRLLKAFSDGSVDTSISTEAAEKKVKVYDFKRPDKFSKDQIRTLYMLHESFGRLLNTYLSTHLRTIVAVDVASVEQLTYQEFVQSMANPSVISILSSRAISYSKSRRRSRSRSSIACSAATAILK